MYQRYLKLDNSSYIEISTRLADSSEKVVLALRGSDSSASPALVSIFLDTVEVDLIIKALQEAREKIGVQNV